VKICPVCSTEYPDDIKFCQHDGTTLRAAAPAANLVGQVVADRYHVVKKLGEGGMGQVYLAEHVKMGRRSAIKVMNPSLVHDPDAVARFNREASNASRITHPNVCAIYDFGETPDGLIYLAMEFVEGEPLTDLLKREGALRPERAVQIFLQTADALQAAHDLGIVHRDLKPDNIMISRGRDGRDVVKVVDFGIAKAVGGDSAGQKVTKTGLVVGTPEFMSPEQLSGDQLDGRSDLYSLALVLFRMLTGKLPFEANTSQEAMIKRLTDEPAKLVQASPDKSFPAGLQEVLDAALTRNPVDRYQTVAKFGENVANVTGMHRGAGGGPVVPHTRADSEAKTEMLEAKQVTAVRAAVKGKRSRLPVAAGAAVVLLGAVGGAIALLGGKKEGNGGTVRSDTAQHGVAANTTATKTSPRGGRGQRSPGSSTVVLGNPSSIDTGVVRHELDQITELVLDPKTAADGRRRATAIYDNAAVPGVQRAQAAFMVANGYFIERRLDEACSWNARALQLNPTRDTYLKFKRDQSCS
jgi:eukaryotic-like serine/threonine-protein kinase